MQELVKAIVGVKGLDHNWNLITVAMGMGDDGDYTFPEQVALDNRLFNFDHMSLKGRGIYFEDGYIQEIELTLEERMIKLEEMNLDSAETITVLNNSVTSLIGLVRTLADQVKDLTCDSNSSH